MTVNIEAQCATSMLISINNKAESTENKRPGCKLMLQSLALEALRGGGPIAPPPFDFFGFKFLLLDRLKISTESENLKIQDGGRL